MNLGFGNVKSKRIDVFSLSCLNEGLKLDMMFFIDLLGVVEGLVSDWFVLWNGNLWCR